MGFATWIIHLICRLCSCRWGWPQFIADTHLLSPRYFFSSRSIKGAIRIQIQMGHVEFRCHSFFFCCAPSRLVFSLFASAPTVGLPTAFWCIRCHSFYLSITVLSMNVVYFYCYQWCIAFHSHLIADTSASGRWYSNPLKRWYSNTSSRTLTSDSRSCGYKDQGDMFYLGKRKVLGVTWRLTPLRL